MKTKSKYQVLCFLLLLGAHLLGAPGGAETDSTKDKYPINDPRNPNCPCHKYQEEADREYAKLLGATGENKGNMEIKGNAFVEHKKAKKVHARHRLWTASQNHKVKACKNKRFRDRLSRCFHF